MTQKGVFTMRIIATLLKPLSFVPALLMMYVIFTFSSQTGTESSNLSNKVTESALIVVDHVLDKGWSEEDIQVRVEKYGFYVRKLAHMTEYCILAITISLPLYVYGLRGFPLLLLAGIICVGFAATDEYHQSMVANRGPSITDVGIDSIGALIGITLVRLFSWIALGGDTRRRRRRRRR